MKISKKKISTFISDIPLVILFVLCFFLTQTYFGTANYNLLSKVYLVLMFCICVFIIIKKHGVIRLSYKEKISYYMLVVPYCILLIWSFVLCVIEKQITFLKVISEIEPRILVPFTACLMYYYFKDRMASSIFWAACINYACYIAVFIRMYGVAGMFHYIALTDLAMAGERPLEAHEITFIFGILIVYYVLMWKKEQHPIKLTISILFCLFGFKRILLFALVISILLYFFIIKFFKENDQIPIYIGVVLFIFCIIWIIICGSGNELADLAQKYNIELSARDKIIGLLKNYYYLGLTYIGKGIGFVHQKMMMYVRAKQSATTGFHNDILMYYIDLGCIPALSFFYYLMVRCMKKIRKFFGFNATINYAIILCCTVICWATDNLATYPNYLMVYNILVLILINGFADNENYKKVITVKNE